MRLMPMLLFLCLTFMLGCTDKISRLEDKLRRTIEEGERGKIKTRIQNRAGFPVKIDRIQIKETFKEIYTHEAVVVFKRRDVREEAKKASLPKLGALPSTDASAGRIRVKFRYLADADRWYFDSFI